MGTLFDVYRALEFCIESLAIGTVVHGPMAIWTNATHVPDVVRTSIGEAPDMVGFEIRSRVGSTERSIVTTALTDTISALEHIVPH